MSEQIWFITGSSRGFGRSLLSAALEAGDRVVATARRPEQLSDVVEKYGDRVFPVALDVTDAEQARAAIAAGVKRFGRLDVIVNNAGYANVSPIEHTSDDDFRTQFETNFWGVYNVSKAAIPVLRAHDGGVIMQFSSVGGRVGGSPGIASYQAAKFAIDGFSRVLQTETAPFGIRVLVVEPSGFATDWAGSSMTVHEPGDGYEQTVGAMNTRMRQSTDGPAGDPDRAAAILVQVAKRKHIPYHLPLGVNATEMSIAQDKRLLAEDEAWSAVSRSADFAEPFPVTFPTDAAQLRRQIAAVDHERGARDVAHQGCACGRGDAAGDPRGDGDRVGARHPRRHDRGSHPARGGRRRLDGGRRLGWRHAFSGQHRRGGRGRGDGCDAA